MDSSVLPHHDPLSRSGTAAVVRACASSMRINPACVAMSAAAAASQKPARYISCVGDETTTPPRAKRLRSGVGEKPPRSQRRPAMSLADRDGVNDLLMSLVQPGLGDSSHSSSDHVIRLPDSLVSFSQANQTGRGGGDGEIEIDVYALGDDALHRIKTRIADYKKTQQEAAVSTVGSRPQGGLSVREALAEVRPAMEAIRRRGMERRRAEARRQVELVVRTVDFNDPYVDWTDVRK